MSSFDLRLTDRQRALVALVVVALGLAPLWPILGWAPWGADALKWIARGSLAGRWEQWDFASKHFVGYRPVTALSFTLDHALGGYHPLVYRATDLGLHAASALLLGWLWVRAAGERSLWFVVPMVLWLGHPVVEEVVPYVGRRSYLLGAVFAIGALLAAHELGRSRRPARLAALTAVLLGLGLLANEAAYAVVPLIPLATLHTSLDRRRIPLLWPAGAVLALALAARIAVLGTLGGYEKRYFATVAANGLPMWSVLDQWEPRRIFTAAVQYVLAPIGVSGGPSLAPEAARLAFVVLAACWLWWVGVVAPVLQWGDRDRRAPLALTLWAGGALLIVVVSQTWFWRLGHPVLVPVALLVGWGLRDGVRALRQRQWGGAISVLMGGAIVASMLWRGPLVRGLDRLPHEGTIASTPSVVRLGAIVPQIRAPATVWLVAPIGADDASMLRAWGEVLGGRRGLGFRTLATLPPGAGAEEGALRLERDPEHPRLVLESGYYFVPWLEIGDEPLDLSALWRRDGAGGWLVALDRRSAWAVTIPGGGGELGRAAPPEPAEEP